MKKLIILFLSLTLAGTTLCFVQAQQLHSSVNAAGGNATGTGGSASYSAGQLVYTTATGTTGSAAQGVQQPFEINVVSGIDDIYGIELFMAYPNPVNTHLVLKIENNELSFFSYQLFDISGSMIKTEKINVIETSINMESLHPATYFLRIFFDNKEVKVFKIIKK